MSITILIIPLYNYASSLLQYLNTYKYLEPQYCVNNVSYNTYLLVSLCYQSNVSIKFLTIHLSCQVLPTTVLCQKRFLKYIFTCESLLPQYCFNKVYCNTFVLPSSYYHSTVSITFLSIHLHLQVFATTVLCQ